MSHHVTSADNDRTTLSIFISLHFSQILLSAYPHHWQLAETQFAQLPRYRVQPRGFRAWFADGGYADAYFYMLKNESRAKERRHTTGREILDLVKCGSLCFCMFHITSKNGLLDKRQR